MSREAFHSNAPASYRNDRSPRSANVGPVPDAATPIAVDSRPSMPLAPRLPSTRSPSRGAMNASRSRTGIELPTTSVPPSGIAAARSRATRISEGSFQESSRRSTADRTAASAGSSHGVLPVGEAVPTTSGIQGSPGVSMRSVAIPSDRGRVRSVSATTIRYQEAAIRPWVARLVGVAPNCTITSGASSPVQDGRRQLLPGGHRAVRPAQPRHGFREHRNAERRAGSAIRVPRTSSPPTTINPLPDSNRFSSISGRCLGWSSAHVLRGRFWRRRMKGRLGNLSGEWLLERAVHLNWPWRVHVGLVREVTAAGGVRRFRTDRPPG